MFERFTDEARAVVVTAVEEARAAGAGLVEPVHLLVGVRVVPGPGADLLRAAGIDLDRLRGVVTGDDGLDADALAAVGVDLSAVRSAVESTFGPGALSGRRRPGRRPRFSPAARKALEQTLRAALRAGSRRLDTRHLLAGLLALDDVGVTAALRAVGADPVALRRDAEGGAAAA